MSRVMIFSRVFPAYHPRKGEPTYFVEKFWNSIRQQDFSLPNTFIPFVKEYCRHMSPKQYFTSMDLQDIKYHTIRAGSRWKPGDIFSPRIWTDRPRRSKQIIIAPDIEVTKTYEVAINFRQTSPVCFIEGKRIDWETLKLVAKNDGLSSTDFIGWFSKPMEDGQIICWNKNISYGST